MGLLTLFAAASGSSTENSSPGGSSISISPTPSQLPFQAAQANQPVERNDPRGPYWLTIVEVVIPPGYWEADQTDPAAGLCGPVDETEFRLATESGSVVAAFDDDPFLDFDRSTSKTLDDSCYIDLAAMGDFVDDLGSVYTVSNGVLIAAFTSEQLFSGQDGGPKISQSFTVLAPADDRPSVAGQPDEGVPGSAPPASLEIPSTTLAPAPIEITTTSAPAVPPTTVGASVSYANCDAARAAGAAPIHRGDPGYSFKLDRDGDGIGCEN